ncbi:MAG: hypothetical protein QOH89_2765 [Pseudonocardiales bacterium]|nr:hypothetical protein [Pseudonocardiales bacterium]
MGAPRHERKLVSVVFCDLVGFTGRAETMDPEDVQGLLSAFHRHVRDELQRHGGTVEKFIGDAVVAVFGAPISHEDDAERAVRAALAIRDWAREQRDLELRLAVNTGEALVSLDVDAAAGEGMVAGDVINTASRIQSAAPVNGVLVGEQTYRATRATISFTDHEPLHAKGKASPVPVWEVDSARARVRTGAVPHMRSAFVGRDRELALLRDAFERMRDHREPQLVTLVAVPGAGKSRLLYELARVIDAEPELVTWRQGQCLPYGDGVSFWALAEIVKAETGILDSDPKDIAADKLAAAVRSLLPASDSDRVERDLRPLVGLVEPGARDAARAGAAFPAWQRFLESLAERGPTVLVVEDLHWADDGLLDFLDDLAAECAGLPLLVVMTARPELLERRPHWGGGKTNTTTVALPPLTEADTARLVAAMLDGQLLSGDLERRLIERASGNPLYAEEFARMITEGGDSALAIPETVQGILAARLDALDTALKRLLQDASVVGATFWLGSVVTMGAVPSAEVEVALRRLEQREFIRRERRTSVEGEIEYTFRHALVRDAAYNQLPRAERSDRHRRVADWITSLGRADDHAELVAHHYLEALGYLKAARREISSIAPAARAALWIAGERALRLSAYPQAARYLSAATELTAPGDPDRGELMFRCGLARLYTDSTGEEILAEAFDVLRAAGRSELAARSALLLARYAWNRLDPGAANRWLAVIDELTAEHPDSPVRLEALVGRSGFAMVAGQYAAAVDFATEALRLLGDDGRADLVGRALDARGTSRCALGDPGGLDDSRRAVDIARQGGAVWELHHALNNMLSGVAQYGSASEERAVLNMWKAAFDEVGGTPYNRQWYLYNEVEFSYLGGAWDDALELADAFLSRIPEGQTFYTESSVLTQRAMIMFARDQDDRARADLLRGLALAEQGRDPQTFAPALCFDGLISLGWGERDQAERDWAKLMAMGEPLADALPQFDISDFCWLAVDLDHVAEAREVIDQCQTPRWANVGRLILDGDPAAAAAALLEMDRPTSAAYCYLRAGGEHLPAARTFYESVAATRFLRELAAEER